MESKELPIKLQHHINSFVHHAYKLCVILSCEKFYQWYYENFIAIGTETQLRKVVPVNIKFSASENNFHKIEEKMETAEVLRLDFQKVSYNKILESQKINYASIKKENDIINFLKNKINSGFYLIILLDEYYLPQKLDYKQNHFIHETLVYGYNDEDETILAVGFDKKFKFCKFPICYNDFNQAFQSGKQRYEQIAPWRANHAVELIKLKSVADYQFDSELFIKSLERFISPVKKHKKINLFDWPRKKQAIRTGIDTYKIIIKSLKNRIKGLYPIDYIAFNVLAEHKKCIYERLKYISAASENADKLESLINEYNEKVVQQFRKIRIIYLKELCKENDFVTIYLPLKNKDAVKKIISMLKSIQKVEKEFTAYICKELKLLFSEE